MNESDTIERFSEEESDDGFIKGKWSDQEVKYFV